MLIGASDPGAMLSHTQECDRTWASRSPPTRPSNCPGWPRPEVRALVDGAAYLFCNEYEEALIERKSGWTGAADPGPGRGAGDHARPERGAGSSGPAEPPVLVGPVPEIRKADPTGTGDAFRSGFLAAVAWGLSLERAAQLGNMLAVHVLETVGPQEYELKPGALAERLRAVYGAAAAAEVSACYS